MLYRITWCLLDLVFITQSEKLNIRQQLSIEHFCATSDITLRQQQAPTHPHPGPDRSEVLSANAGVKTQPIKLIPFL